jgi:hypothetical protein
MGSVDFAHAALAKKLQNHEFVVQNRAWRECAPGIIHYCLSIVAELDSSTLL